jgi:hypothetical protein
MGGKFTFEQDVVVTYGRDGHLFYLEIFRLGGGD